MPQSAINRTVHAALRLRAVRECVIVY